MLGAEEFGFATAPLVTLGCAMMRVCNLDTCPMGIATQNPKLRENFTGKPEYVENFMLFIARELREIMAGLGVRTLDELVGRTDLLRIRDDLSEQEKKLDLSPILAFSGDEKRIFDPKALYDFKLEKVKDQTELLKDKKILDAIKSGKPCRKEVRISNTDRTFGTLLGARIIKENPEGLKDDTITLDLKGAGGQSFGAFIPGGLTLNLTGDSNDYFGKGLSGGKLIVKAPETAAYPAEENIIIGNVALYGATSGEAYIAGVAGERFCVRNSGATAVVEGVGEHGCEYMTGGRAVIIGPVGKNFAAGMSGGIAYVLDEDNSLYRNLNKDLVLMEKVEHKNDREELRSILSKHAEYTGSSKAKKILEDFDAYIPKFKKIIPEDYKRLLALTGKYEEQGISLEDAGIEAFYESIKGKGEK